MSFIKSIPPELRAQLNALNEAVDAAVNARTKFLDDHMAEVSLVKIDDPLYDRDTRRLVGYVTALYRYWQNRDWRYDNQFSVEVKFRHPLHTNYIDNTSRQPYKITHLPK